MKGNTMDNKAVEIVKAVAEGIITACDKLMQNQETKENNIEQTS